MSNQLELNNGICEEHNGFRVGRSTGDHLCSLSLIVKSCIKRKLNTFGVFIDFSKAYDRVNRDLLWHKLSVLGVNGKMLNSVKSLYEHVQCTVRVNRCYSDWFDVHAGLKQGCVLSPLLFNAFMNDLIHVIRSLNCGVPFDKDDSVSILLYADDIVLLSDNEQKLQTMLDCLNDWCHAWGLTNNNNNNRINSLRQICTIIRAMGLNYKGA